MHHHEPCQMFWENLWTPSYSLKSKKYGYYRKQVKRSWFSTLLGTGAETGRHRIVFVPYPVITIAWINRKLLESRFQPLIHPTSLLTAFVIITLFQKGFNPQHQDRSLLKSAIFVFLYGFPISRTPFCWAWLLTVAGMSLKAIGMEESKLAWQAW